MNYARVSVAPAIVSRRVGEAYVVLNERTLTAHELTGETAQLWTAILERVEIDLASTILADLTELGLVVPVTGINRRVALKRAGAIAAVEITTLALPEAAAAASATSLNTVVPGTFCVTVPAGRTTASFSITGAGGGSGGLTSLVGGAGGGGAKLSGTISGLLPGDVVVVRVGSGGAGGFALSPGAGGSGYDNGGNGAASATGGGGGGGAATVIGVVRGAPAGSCPANQVWTGATANYLAVAGGGGGGGSTGTVNGGNAGTTNNGSVTASGQNGKNGGLLNLFGGGGGGGGSGGPAAGGVGGGGTGGGTGWVTSNPTWPLSVVSSVVVNNGGSALLLGASGGDGAGIVTFP